MEKISCNPEGHRKGRKRKADQVKKGKMRRSSKGSWRKGRGPKSKQGMDLIPVNVISARLKPGISGHMTDCADHIAMSVLPVVPDSTVLIYREDIYCRQ